MSIETPNSIGRLANIQSLRGFAALLVVLSHLVSIEQKYSPDQILGTWARLGIVGVDIFFVISGFIMVHVVWNKRRSLYSMAEFLFSRITRIYPLYWFVSAIIFALYLWRPSMVFSSIATEPNILKSFLLIPEGRPPLLLVGWTLIHEMGFYLVFSLTLLFKPKYLLPFLALWASLIVFTYLYKIGPNSLTEGSTFSGILLNPLTLEFIAGAFAAWVFHKTEARFARISLALGIALFVFVIIKLTLVDLRGLSTFMGRTLAFTLPATLMLYGLAGIKTKLPNWTQTLGDWSYSLYLTHVLSLSLFGRIWHLFAIESIFDNLPVLILMTLLSVVVAGLTWKLIERPLHNLSKTLRRRLFSAPA